MLFTQRFYNQSSFDEGFRCDDLELTRLYYMLTSFRIVDPNG